MVPAPQLRGEARPVQLGGAPIRFAEASAGCVFFSGFFCSFYESFIKIAMRVYEDKLYSVGVYFLINYSQASSNIDTAVAAIFSMKNMIIE